MKKLKTFKELFCWSNLDFLSFVYKMLEFSYTDNEYKYEIGIDEAGRGPLFGRLYVAGVVLPTGFFHKDVKDSKKIKSQKKLETVAQYIRENALAFHVEYVEHDVIDRINILQSVYEGMHACVKKIMEKMQITCSNGNLKDVFLLIDGDRFKPYTVYDDATGVLTPIAHKTVEGGDAMYMSIAAASILAKTERDAYIRDLCKKYPELETRYKLTKNMGYGTKQHIEGIEKYGISQWHRRSYARCKGVVLVNCEERQIQEQQQTQEPIVQEEQEQNQEQQDTMIPQTQTMEVCVFEGFWSIEDVRSKPDYLFIFGDNDIKHGKKGQAIIRDEPNVCGIPTKKLPTFAKNAFYNDAEYEDNIRKIDNAIDTILFRVKTENYKGIILPNDGIGTGLSKLNTCAPKTFEYLSKKIDELSS